MNTRIAFTGSTLLGAMSAAYSAGIANFQGWSERVWNGKEWTLVYDLAA